MTEKEYNECVDQYADNVYRFIYKNLRHQEDARDVVQTAFEKLWRHRDQVDTERSKNYLFTIAYNQMIDHIRKHKRVSLTDSVPEVAVGQQSDRTKQALLKALEHLNHTQKCLVMLKDYEGYSYREIGTIMGLNETQVKVYLHRARLALRNYLVSPDNILADEN